jgi:hypothetical protein
MVVLVRLMLCLGALGLSVGCVHAAEKFPKGWRATMTNNPATNQWLPKYAQKLSDPLADGIRNVMLFSIVNHYCDGVTGDRATMTSYIKGLKLEAAGVDQRRGAKSAAEQVLTGLTYEGVAHLCAGVDYMFGPRGILIVGAMKSGTGEPKDAYDPSNPYMALPDLKVE